MEHEGVRKGDDLTFEVTAGIRFEPQEFLKEAVARGHPFSMFQGVSSSMQHAIRSSAAMSDADLVRRRATFFKRWTDRAQVLEDDERRLHQNMPAHRQRVLKGKRLLMMREILQDLGYTDVGVVNAIIKGFDLVGPSDDCPALPATFQPASVTIDELSETALSANSAIFNTTASSGDDWADAEMWRKTKKEIEKGWLSEKLDSDEALSEGRVSRRFPVVQSGKVRCVDNYSESQVNDAISVTSKPTVDGVDTIAAMSAELMKALDEQGKSKALKGRSFDLTSAYRQLPVADSSLQWAKITAFDPESKRPACFQQYALPFGAKGAVVAFIRCARALQWIAHQLLLVISCFYDDYVLVSPESTCDNAERSYGLLLDLLGWSYDKEGEKSDRMSKQVSALGVLIDFSSSGSGQVFIDNTENRKKELVKALDEAREAGRLSPQEAAKLKGRMSFAEGQIFGRVCRGFFNSLSQHVRNPTKNDVLDEQCMRDLTKFRETFINSKRRVVDSCSKEVFYVFTDASFEDDRSAGLGAILFDEKGRALDYFSTRLLPEDCDRLFSSDREQLITELEALAVLAALCLWHQRLVAKHVVIFCDNEGAKGAILKGYSPSKWLHDIACKIAAAEEAASLFIWYSRVPSESNPADDPSRGRLQDWVRSAKRSCVDLAMFEELVASA